MTSTKSNPTINYLKSNASLIKYTKLGLVNITSLARYIKDNNKAITADTSVAAIGMDIRRYLKTVPESQKTKYDFSKLHLKLVTRSNIQELIFTKNSAHRQISLDLFEQISNLNNFSCLVEGEKEIVIMTDHPLDKFLENQKLAKTISHHTSGLGFISVDFPLELRKVVGVYAYITTSLKLADIPIHSFHTIGGEILILVKNEDLISTQEVLTSAIKNIE